MLIGWKHYLLFFFFINKVLVSMAAREELIRAALMQGIAVKPVLETHLREKGLH